jgi:hypothetical protein
MRAFDGQRSDNRPIQRTRAEKVRQLDQLRAELKALKPHAAPALRQSIRARISELEYELGDPRAPSAPTSPPAPKRG